MVNKIDECSCCQQQRYLVNKTKKLCSYCNNKRLCERKPPTVRKGIRNVSRKHNIVKANYDKLVRALAQERDNVCGGCGTNSHLTNSHLIPRSRRPDLVLNPLNIAYHCLDCHEKWANKPDERRFMLDFKHNMQIVEQLDPLYYNILISTCKTI